MTSKLAFLIPAYNAPTWKPSYVEEFRSGLKQLEEAGTHPFVVWVDDGSSREETKLEAHASNLSSLGREVFTTTHSINRGQGAALQTGLEIARLHGADLFVTFDSDGQHQIKDVPVLLEKLRSNNLNIVFGNRFAAKDFKQSNIPFSRKILLRLATLFEVVTTRIKLSDAHNGLRLFDLKAAGVLNLQQDRMAHATEVKIKVRKNRLRYGEAPVSIRYLEEITGGQSNSESIRILTELLEGWLFR